MLIAPFNDAEVVAGLVREHRDELAGVIVEPFQRIIPPAPGFLQALRKITADNGVPLIFDEVVTGFRLAYGGAQEYYGVVPDLCTLGKVIGGGFPLAAIAGRADIMAHFDRNTVGDEGFLMQIGTLSGNPVAAAAGLATLEILRRPGAYERLFATGRELMETLAELLRRKRASGPGHRRAAVVRCRLQQRADPRLPRRPARRRGEDAAVQRAAAPARHPQGRIQILRVAGAYARGHRPCPRGLGLGARRAGRRLRSGGVGPLRVKQPGSGGEAEAAHVL